MDGFDALLAGSACRAAVDEEEEAAAEAALAASPPPPPLLTWTPAALTALAPAPAPVALLLLGCGVPAATLLHALPCPAYAGCLLLPEASLKGNALRPAPRDTGVCHLWLTASRVLVAATGDADGCPPERARVWLATLLAAVTPARVCLLAPLPPGPLVGGVPAALLEHVRRPTIVPSHFTHLTPNPVPPCKPSRPSLPARHARPRTARTTAGTGAGGGGGGGGGSGGGGVPGGARGGCGGAAGCLCQRAVRVRGGWRRRGLGVLLSAGWQLQARRLVGGAVRSPVLPPIGHRFE